MSHCTEIYVYEIHEDRLDDFLAIKDRLIEEAESLTGLIASGTFQSDSQPNRFLDRMTWESAQAATSGSQQFEKLVSSASFLSMMTGPPKISGRFTLVAGS